MYEIGKVLSYGTNVARIVVGPLPDAKCAPRHPMKMAASVSPELGPFLLEDKEPE
jgi:hypothetical protein